MEPLKDTTKPLNDKELELILTLILRLYTSTNSQDIKRVAKSLFNLLTRYRFTPSENKDIVF